MGFKTLDTRIYSICGILAVLVMSVDVIIGIILDPTWNFNDNVICDLGVSDDATIATSFLISCCASGILFIISSMMWMSKDSKLMKMTGIFTILSGFPRDIMKNSIVLWKTKVVRNGKLFEIKKLKSCPKKKTF